MTNHRDALRDIRTFPSLIKFLRDHLDWPIHGEDFEELTFDYTPEELGIDAGSAAKIQEIKRLRPLSTRQPWGIFFVKFEPRLLPVVALRRVLGRVVVKKRASANSAERAAWAADDLLFISNYGEGDQRQITFAHFSQDPARKDLPTLKVLGWDNLDTALHLDHVAEQLTEKLHWPNDTDAEKAWRDTWRSAFTLRHREVITTSQALASKLAELARAIHDRIKAALAIETATGPLTQLMLAFQKSLIHDLDRDSFADMYAQTIAYGLLSARIANPAHRTGDDMAAQMPVTNPFLRDLMSAFLDVGGRKGKRGKAPGIDFDELGMSEVVDLLDDAKMEEVVRDFGDRNPQEDPVIHFYELFLREYDAKKRMQRGVFYTPRPVVSFIVRSVHEALQNEFGLADGLADTATWGQVAKRIAGLKLPDGVKPGDRFVSILDPATGTGTFLVEVIEMIYVTLVEKWKRERHSDKKMVELWNEWVPEHLLPRLHGYELLMAPYAIAHLKIGLKLRETGYRFASDERARVYLTNALEPAQDFSSTFEFAIPALAHEAEAVNAVKRRQRFTIVIGNPPYAGHSVNNQIPWIVDKVYDYKRGLPDLQKPGQAKWLQDDYVKFLRFSQWIIDESSMGVLGFITNHKFLGNPTFRGMRRLISETFSDLRFLDLHGNSKAGEVRPDSGKDENIFDIQQGVAVSVLVRGTSQRIVRQRDIWGDREHKYRFLVSHTATGACRAILTPAAEFFLFVPQKEDLRAEYESWTSLKEAMNRNGDPAPGIVTTQDEFAVAFTKSEIKQHVESLLGTRTEEEARSLFRLCTQSQWNYANAKRELSTGAWVKDIKQLVYRPFDVRWTVFNPHVAVHRRERVMRHMLAGKNLALITTRSVEIGRGFEHVFCTRSIIQHHTVSIKEVNFLIPLFLFPDPDGLRLSSAKAPNFSLAFLRLLSASLGVSAKTPDAVPEGFSAEEIFFYIYAVLHSPGYRSRYEGFLRVDFPRLPTTSIVKLFRALAALGGELVDLHLLESPKLERHLTAFVGSPPGRVEKISYDDGTVWIDKKRTRGFRGVPEAVWNFHIGGYQVCEKWLQDRGPKGGQPGRNLSADDIAHYDRIVIALNETIRLMHEIDDVIDAHGGWPAAFQDAPATKLIPFAPRIVKPRREERYVTCLPLVPLKVAAGAFSEPQRVSDDEREWVEVGARHRPRPGLFVAQVVGRSMEPAIPDGSFCIFSTPVTGARPGRTVLVQLRDGTDPETGERYTVKRYESEKVQSDGSWRHTKITLRPNNHDFAPIELSADTEDQVQVIAEFMAVLGE